MERVNERTKKILENIVFYLFMVFHPPLLIRIAREYLEASKMITKATEDIERLNHHLHSSLYK
jgi:hypothetical protein